MPGFLKQSTAASLMLGPFIDPDGITEETALTPASELSKNGNTFGAGPTGTHISEGWYDFNLTTAHTDTIGRLVIKSQDSANHLPMWDVFYVLHANVFDSLFNVAGQDTLDVQVTGVGANVITAASIADSAIDSATFANDTGLRNIRSATAQTGAPGSITLDTGASSVNEFYAGQLIRIVSGAGVGQVRIITAYNGTSKVASVSPSWESGQEPDFSSVFVVMPFGAANVSSWRRTVVSSLVSGRVDAAVGVMAANSVTAAALAADAVAEIADGVWDEDIVAAHGTADTAGLLLSRLTGRALPTGWSADVVANSVLDQLADDGTAVYDRTTDSLQAIRDSGGGAPTAAAIADAVWDEAQGDHVAAGSFGEIATEIASILDDTGTSGVVLANGAITAAKFAAGAIDASAIAADAIGASQLAATAVAELADGVWDEDIVAAHGTADTAGLLLSRLTGRALPTGWSADVVANSVFDQLADDGTAVYDRTTDSLQALRDNQGSPAPSAATIADAVWDEAQGDHVAAGSFGEIATEIASILDDTGTSGVAIANSAITAAKFAAGAIDASAIASDAITAAKIATDAITAAKIATGAITAAKFAANAIDAAALAADAVAEVADGVWDENIVAAHGTADTAGLILSRLTHRALPTGWGVDVVEDSVFDFIADDGTAAYDRTTDSLQALSDSGGGGPTAASIADAVWDEAQADHTTPGSFGEIASEIADILDDTGTSGVIVASLAANSITSTVLANGAITAAKFAAGAIDASAIAASAITASKFAAGAIDAAAIADNAIDTATFAAETGLRPARSGTAQAGAVTSITLDAGASSINDFYAGSRVRITGGTGATQTRIITAYNGTSKVATISPAWGTNPDATSTFALVPGVVNVSSWRRSVPNALLSGRVDVSVGAMQANVVTASAINAGAITSGKFAAGAIDATVIAANAIGSSQLATTAVNEIVDQVWDEAQGDHVAAGSFGEIATEIATLLTNLATAQLDLDTITGTNGVTLATSQPNYAPATAADAASPAEVATEVADALRVDTLSELAQAQPSASPSFESALMLLYMALRNQLDIDVGTNTKEIYNNAGTVIAKKTISDDGTTYSEAKMVSGP